MLKNLKWTAVVVTAVSVFGWVGLSPAHARVELNIAHAYPVGSSVGLGATRFADMAERLSGGYIDIAVFPGAQHGSELEMLEGVRLGRPEMVIVYPGYAAMFGSTFSVTGLPFLSTNSESAWEVLNGPVGHDILDLMEPKGIKGLAWGVQGFRGFLTNGFAINSVDDLKGRRIRIAPSPLHDRTIRVFGGNPVPMAFSDVFSALQRNTIDGVETSYAAMADAQQYQVATHLAVSNHNFISAMYLMNLDVYNSLSPEHQEVIMQSALAATQTMSAAAHQTDENAIALMQANGITVTRPAFDPFVAGAKVVHEWFLDDLFSDRELIERLLGTGMQSVGGGDTCSRLACPQGQECCDGKCKDSC